MAYKVTYEFVLSSDQTMGWTESYWVVAGSLAQAITAGATLQPYRMALSPLSVLMPYWRVSAYPYGTRQATVLITSKNPALSVQGSYSSAATLSGWTKLLIRLATTAPSHTEQWLGGMPANIVGNNAGLTFAGTFKTALNTFFNQLAGLNFAVRQQLQTGANAKYPVLAISAAGVFSIPGNTLGPVGNNVHLTYMPPGFGFRGTFPVASNDGNNVTFVGITPPGVAVPVKKSQPRSAGGLWLHDHCDEYLTRQRWLPHQCGPTCQQAQCRPPCKPAYWAPEAPQDVAGWSACGAIMDLLRSCYRSQMRLYSDRPDVLTWGQWHWCPADAIPAPPSAFVSSIWDQTRAETYPLGEVASSHRKWKSGRGNARLDGQHYCGAAAWLTGIPYAARPGLAVDASGIPLCCQALPAEPGGLVLGGVGTFLGPYQSIEPDVLCGCGTVSAVVT